MKAGKNKSSSKNRSDFAQFIDKLILKLEDNPSHIIKINDLAHKSGIEKRRIYDLMNVLVACGISTKVESCYYRWEGLNCSAIALQNLSEEYTSKAKNIQVDNLFILPDSPGIGVLASTFIAVYIFFGLKTLNIRDASLLMAHTEAKSKPILRRLYLVAFLLEHIGLIKHSDKIGEYEVIADVTTINRETYVKLLQNGFFSPFTIEYQLNRFDDVYITKVFSERQADFVRSIQIHLSQNFDDTPINYLIGRKSIVA